MPHSQIKLVGSTLYTVTHESIAAIDITTGNKRWVYKLSSTGESFENISADQESVYATCNCRYGRYPRLIVLNAKSGKERWQGPSWGYLNFSSQIPIITQDLVFVKARECGKCDNYSSAQNWIAALSAADGSERWRFSLSNPVRLHGATDGNIVILEDEMPRWRNWLIQINPAWH